MTTTLQEVRHLVAKAFPRRTVAGFEPLSGGLCNINLKVTFESNDHPAVLRLYQRDPFACQKEVELLGLVRKTVPVAEVFYADFQGTAGPFAILEYVSGITFQQLKQTKDLTAIHQASYSSGQTLAAIGQFGFSKSGRLEAGLSVGEPYVEGADPVPQFLDSCLASEHLKRRTGEKLAVHLHDLIWSWAERLRGLTDLPNVDSRLVHSDFGSRNILVREVDGKWIVAAVLDWEFAFSGSPLFDVGHFLRYERSEQPLREPEFSRGFLEHGGKLPDDWQHLVKLLDLTATCELLTRAVLPDEIVNELVGLTQATLEDVPMARSKITSYP